MQARQRSSIRAKIAISNGLVAHFGVKFGVPAALRALSSTISNCTSGSSGLSRRVILHHARDLWNQRAKCDNVGPKLFVFLVGYLGITRVSCVRLGGGFLCCGSYTTCKCGKRRDTSENSLGKVWARAMFFIRAKIAISGDLVAYFGVRFGVSAALRALSSTNSVRTSDS